MIDPKILSATKKLYEEFKQISYTYGLKLPTPIVQISQAKSFLGRYDSRLNRIEISHDLVFCNPWFVVLGVFKHEIAHLMTAQKHPDASAHGFEFAASCERIATPKWARSACTDLELATLSQQEALSPSDQRLVRRFEKLISMSQSNNEHESALAMQRAKEILCRHTFVEDALRHKQEPFDCQFRTYGKKKIPSYRVKLESLLAEHYNINVIYDHLYDVHAQTDFRASVWLGERHCLKIADYVESYVLRVLPRFWEEHQKKFLVKGLRAKNSFYEGVLDGFASKLQQQSELNLNRQTVNAVQKHYRAKLDGYTRSIYPKIVHRGGGRRQIEQNSYSAGKTCGHNLQIHSGVESGQGRSQKRLGASI